MKRLIAYICVLLSTLGYVVYSYSQLDPNLVLSSFGPYWRFQEMMWQMGYHQRDLSAVYFTVIILFFFVGAWMAYTSLQEHEKWSLFFTVIVLMFVAHNALSHDIFNYMFNARMVVKYQADPHVRVALDFPSDDWTRFMHNTHTPAPYGYGWTALSLFPYVLGFHKFNPTYLAFKLFMVGGLLLLYRAILYLSKISDREKDFHYLKWLVLLNPLIIIELVGNLHNDAWMMMFALFAYGVVFSLRATDSTIKLAGKLLLATVFLLASISIKFVTVLLVPMLLCIAVSKLAKNVPRLLSYGMAYWPEISALLVFVPLFTERSQQFHPWYLSWGLVFVPFMKKTWVRFAYLAFSISSMLRYIPFLRLGEYTQEILMQQKVITWVGGLVIFVLFSQVKKDWQLKHLK
ncbi:MAG: hypothetical protein HZA34_01530 [Candidatus Pacebacteria bacterium]|nr:hypothetical protein [Candidatus Paceibacterota bacterium]